MKQKLIIVVIITVALAALYGTTKVLASEEPDITVVDEGEQTIATDFWGQHMGPHLNQYTLTQEEHEAVVEKRVELVDLYLSNYGEKTSEERHQQEALYHSELQDFMTELLGYDINFNYFNQEGRMSVRLTQAQHEEMMIKKIELINLHLENYSVMASDEKYHAEQQYHQALQTYMYQLMNRTNNDTYRGQYNGGAYGSCHGGSYGGGSYGDDSVQRNTQTTYQGMMRSR